MKGEVGNWIKGRILTVWRYYVPSKWEKASIFPNPGISGKSVITYTQNDNKSFFVSERFNLICFCLFVFDVISNLTFFSFFLQKHGPRMKCAACKIIAHTSCIPILMDRMKFYCKPTFRDVGVRQYREQTSIHHHWVHRRYEDWGNDCF